MGLQREIEEVFRRVLRQDLARISRLLKSNEFRKKLLHASSKEEVVAIIKEEDEEF